MEGLEERSKAHTDAQVREDEAAGTCVEVEAPVTFCFEAAIDFLHLPFRLLFWCSVSSLSPYPSTVSSHCIRLLCTSPSCACSSFIIIFLIPICHFLLFLNSPYLSSVFCYFIHLFCSPLPCNCPSFCPFNILLLPICHFRSSIHWFLSLSSPLPHFSFVYLTLLWSFHRHFPLTHSPFSHNS